MSSKSVRDLDRFEKHIVNPIETILNPYYDTRHGYTLSDWFKIISDALEFGCGESAAKNPMPTGNIEINRKEKEIYYEVIKLRSVHIKRNKKRILQLAKLIIKSHPLEKSLYRWSTETQLLEPVQTAKNKSKDTAKGKLKGQWIRTKYK